MPDVFKNHLYPEVGRLLRKIATARAHPQTPQNKAAIQRHQARVREILGQPAAPTAPEPSKRKNQPNWL